MDPAETAPAPETGVVVATPSSMRVSVPALQDRMASCQPPSHTFRRPFAVVVKLTVLPPTIPDNVPGGRALASKDTAAAATATAAESVAIWAWSVVTGTTSAAAVEASVWAFCALPSAVWSPLATDVPSVTNWLVCGTIVVTTKLSIVVPPATRAPLAKALAADWVPVIYGLATAHAASTAALAVT